MGAWTFAIIHLVFASLVASGFFRLKAKGKSNLFISVITFFLILPVSFVISVFIGVINDNGDYVVSIPLILIVAWFLIASFKKANIRFSGIHFTKKAQQDTATVDKPSKITITRDSSESKPETKPDIIPETTFQVISNKIQFGYTDAGGNYTFRNVRVLTVDSEYLEARDLDKKSDRTFRVERIDDEIIDLETGEIVSKQNWLKQYNVTQIKHKEPIYTSHWDEPIVAPKIEICFTGFTKAKRAELEKKAEKNGYLVRKSVTLNLNYLVCGKTAGPSKIAKANESGVVILTEDEFLNMLVEK